MIYLNDVRDVGEQKKEQGNLKQRYFHSDIIYTSYSPTKEIKQNSKKAQLFALVSDIINKELCVTFSHIGFKLRASAHLKGLNAKPRKVHPTL